MLIGFTTATISTIPRKVNTFNQVIPKNKHIKVAEHDIFYGVKSLFIRIEQGQPLTLHHQKNESNNGESNLFVFLGNDKATVSKGSDEAVDSSTQLLGNFNARDDLRIKFSEQFNGVFCLFSISEEWQKTYQPVDNLVAKHSRSIPTILAELKTPYLLENRLNEIKIVSQVFFETITVLNSLSQHNTDKFYNINQVIKYLKDNIDAPQPSLHNLSQIAYMSVSGLKVKFKQYTGKSIQAFFIDEKMQYASTLLGQGKPVKEVATMVGYTVPQSFSNAFRRTKGVSPKEYSNQIKKHTKEQ